MVGSMAAVETCDAARSEDGSQGGESWRRQGTSKAGETETVWGEREDLNVKQEDPGAAVCIGQDVLFHYEAALENKHK